MLLLQLPGTRLREQTKESGQRRHRAVWLLSRFPKDEHKVTLAHKLGRNLLRLASSVRCALIKFQRARIKSYRARLDITRPSLSTS